MSGEGVPEAGPCVPLLQGHQPGFSHAGDSSQGGLQVTGGLGSLPECSHHSAIPMATPLVKMLELVFMLADIEKKKSWTQTEFFSRKEAGRRGQAGTQTVLAAILVHLGRGRTQSQGLGSHGLHADHFLWPKTIPSRELRSCVGCDL